MAVRAAGPVAWAAIIRRMNARSPHLQRSPVRASVVVLRVIGLTACLYLGIIGALNAWFIVGPELATGELTHRRLAAFIGAAVLSAIALAISLFRTRSLRTTAAIVGLGLPVMAVLFLGIQLAWRPTV